MIYQQEARSIARMSPLPHTLNDLSPIAQSLIEDLTVVTNDKQFNNYNIKHYW